MHTSLRSPLPELERRLEALAAYARSLPLSRPSAQARASVGGGLESLRPQQERLEALRVEAVLMLEQAGLGERLAALGARAASAPLRSRAPLTVGHERQDEDDKSVDLSTEDIPKASRATPAPLTTDLADPYDLERALELGATLPPSAPPVAADVAASDLGGLIDIDALLSEVETELARADAAAGVGEAGGQRVESELTPTRRVEAAPPPLPSTPPQAIPHAPLSAHAGGEPLSAEALIERLSTLAPAPQALSAPSAPPAPRPSPAAEGGKAWTAAKELLRALLPPPSRSPDAELPFIPASSARARVSALAPWLRLDEVDWSGLDWRMIQREAGPYASLSLAPRAVAPASPTPRRPVALRLEVQGDHPERAVSEGALDPLDPLDPLAESYGPSELSEPSEPSEPSPSEPPSHDSLDMDAAFAEYDAPISEEDLLADPELAEIARSYASLERHLGDAVAPTMASGQMGASAREVVFGGLDPNLANDLGLDALAPAVLPSDALSSPTGEPRLDLPSSPFDSINEVRFDFGEEDPLVWTEGSPTPLFGDEASPSPILRGLSSRDPLNTPRSKETPVSPEPEGGWREPSAAEEAQRSGVFQRLFGRR